MAGAAGHPTNEPSNYFAIGKQSAKDTEATTFYFLKHLDGTALNLDTQFESVREGGDGQEVGLRYKTAISMDGDAVANSRPEWAARIFSYALGADGATTPVAAAASGLAQTHIAVPTSTLPYLTAEQRVSDDIERVSNAQVTGLTFEGEAGRPLKITANLVGGGTPYRRDVASTLTPARESDPPFFFPNASVVIDGAGNTQITKYSAQVQRAVDSDIRTTTLFREDVVPLNMDTGLDFTLKYTDKTLYDKIEYLAGSVISPDALGLATGSFKIFAGYNLGGASERFVEANFPIYQYVAVSVNRLDPDGKTMYLDVSAAGLRGATYQFFTRVQTASGGAF
jgi:hypothetical protein